MNVASESKLASSESRSSTGGVFSGITDTWAVAVLESASPSFTTKVMFAGRGVRRLSRCSCR